MISIVCVYNNEVTLKNALLASLKDQTADFELIKIDNADGKFKSAAEALNYGGSKANGDYIMFVHQDMWLGSGSWLEDAERALISIPDLGIAGVAGQSEKGRTWEERCRWSILSEALRDREPAHEPEEVQTLDECLLIVPRSVFGKLQFDERVFDGWHCYGVDYCLSVRQFGLKAYVIPGSCSHSCARQNMKDLLKYQKRLYKKHKKYYKQIYTWTGEISWMKLKIHSLSSFLSPIYLRFFPDVPSTLNKQLIGCNSLLDLGCGHHSLLVYCDDLPLIKYSVGVELFEPYLLDSKRKNIHSQYVRADARSVEFKPGSFDTVVAVELLEHLTKQEGAALLPKMEEWSSRKVVITTPNGYVWQDAYHNNPYQEHKSGWSAKELRERGFEVFGVNGWKRLRGYKSSVKYKPAFFWRRISDLTQKITYHWPDQAFQLLAIKHVDHDD